MNILYMTLCSSGDTIASLIGFPVLPLPQYTTINGGCMYIMTNWTFSSLGTLTALKYGTLNDTSISTNMAVIRPVSTWKFLVVHRVQLPNNMTMLEVNLPVEEGDTVAIMAHDKDVIGLPYGTLDDSIAESIDLSNVIIFSEGCQNDTISLSPDKAFISTKIAFPLLISFEAYMEAGLLHKFFDLHDFYFIIIL